MGTGFVIPNAFPELLHGFEIRPPVADEAPALAEIIRACEFDLTGKSEMTLNDFLGDWEGVDLDNDARVVVDSVGTPVAYADINERGNVIFSVYGYVDPKRRGEGIGSTIVAWSERRAQAAATAAPDGARVVARHYINRRDEAAQSLLTAKGYTPVRVTFTMAIELETPSVVEWPEGLTVRTFQPGADDQIAYEAYEEAFADMWQRPRGTFDQFLSKLRRPYFDPALWFLVMDGEQIAGTIFASDIDGNGWIEIVGVRRPWRGRGVASAMLKHVFNAYLERGVTHVGLSVDGESPTGAPRIYERAGMRLDQTYLLFERELRPGYQLGLEQPSE